MEVGQALRATSCSCVDCVPGFQSAETASGADLEMLVV